MSINLELTIKDYKTILNWYELAFAKSQAQKTSDDVTFKKISVMCLARLDELKDNELKDDER